MVVFEEHCNDRPIKLTYGWYQIFAVVVDAISVFTERSSSELQKEIFPLLDSLFCEENENLFSVLYLCCSMYSLGHIYRIATENFLQLAILVSFYVFWSSCCWSSLAKCNTHIDFHTCDDKTAQREDQSNNQKN